MNYWLLIKINLVYLETFENEVTSPSMILNDDNKFSDGIGDYLKQLKKI